MRDPLVSVAMVTCNVDRFLAESIESVLGQTLKDFELIVVDFGSTDNSRQIIQSYAAKDSRIRCYEISKCSLPAARNVACLRGRGKYIAVMDADDICLPDRLLRQVDFMERNPDVAILGAAVEWIDAAGKSFHVHRHPIADAEIRAELQTHSVFWHPTVVVRRDAFVAVGGYRPVFVCAHDYDLAVRIAEKYRCANLNETVLRYRIHSSQITSDRKQLQALCVLAVHASAEARHQNIVDPLESAERIDSAALAKWGVSESTQRKFIVADAHTWIRNLMSAGEYETALAAAEGILKSNLDGIDPWLISEINLHIAAMYRKKKSLWKAFVALKRAVTVRPVLIGRPFKSILRGFRQHDSVSEAS